MQATSRPVLLPGILIAAMPVPAAASAFQLLEQSAGQLGSAYAGSASVGSDASAVFFNPAAMALLEGPQLSASGSVLSIQGEFEERGGSTASGPTGEIDESAVLPAFYYTAPLAGGVTLGLGANAPFGLSTSYDENWRGRYHATETSLTARNFSSTLAFETTERLSLGIGVNYQTIDARLENEVNAFAVCAPVAGEANCANDGLDHDDRSQDSSARIEGEDRGFGLDLSLLYRLGPRSRIGLAIRQGVDYTLEGEADFDRSSACAANAACNGVLDAWEGDVEADLELPDVVTLSATHALGDAWSVHGDVAWTGWSSIDEVRVASADDGTEVSTLDLDYSDTLRLAVGLSHAVGNATWRAGLAHDQSPQTDPDHTTPRIPDGDRTQLAFGVTVDLREGQSVDLGYMHIHVDETAIDNEAQGHRLDGKFDVSADILAAQANWRF